MNAKSDLRHIDWVLLFRCEIQKKYFHLAKSQKQRWSYTIMAVMHFDLLFSFAALIIWFIK